MDFDIDVSGDDLLNPDYTICIANKDSIIRGFKFDKNTKEIISSKFGQDLYRYGKSKNGKAQLKIRIYCIIIYYLFKSLRTTGELNLNICKDFYGREKDIENNLNYFLIERLGFKKVNFNFRKLEKDSNAHKYAYLMRKDTKHIMNNYVKISLKEIEEFIKRK